METRILTKTEIDNLNQDGFSLDSKKTYIQSFLINDKINKAGDHRGRDDHFKVNTKALDKLGRSAIGRPYVIPPEDLVGHVGQVLQDFDAILEYQKAYAVGEIVDYWINRKNNNVNVIIEALPSISEKLLTGKIPPFVSPMVEFLETDPNTGELLDGRIVHLQAVKEPGYDKSIAKINAVCEGGLKECMSELKIKGANGLLNCYQKQHSTFFNRKLLSTKQMSEQQPTIESLKAEIDELKTQVKGAAAMGGSGGTVLETKPTDSKVEPSVGMTTETSSTSPSKDEFETLKTNYDTTVKEFEALKEKMKKEEENRAAEERKRIAGEIIESELKLHMINPKDKDAKLKELVESKNDLTLLHNTLKEQASKIKGASAYEYIDVAQLQTDSQTNYDDVFEGVLN